MCYFQNNIISFVVRNKFWDLSYHTLGEKCNPQYLEFSFENVKMPFLVIAVVENGFK